FLRVISVAPPAAIAEAVAAAETAAAPAVVVPGIAAAGTVAGQRTAANASASPVISAAGEIQATEAPSPGIYPGGLTAEERAVAGLPAQAASASGPISEFDVAPLLRSDPSAAFSSDLPYSDPALMAARAADAAAAQTGAARAGATAAAAITPGANQFAATVVGTTAGGQPVLLAGQSLLTVRAAPLETGSQLILQLT